MALIRFRISRVRRLHQRCVVRILAAPHADHRLVGLLFVLQVTVLSLVIAAFATSPGRHTSSYHPHLHARHPFEILTITHRLSEQPHDDQPHRDEHHRVLLDPPHSLSRPTRQLVALPDDL